MFHVQVLTKGIMDYDKLERQINERNDRFEKRIDKLKEIAPNKKAC